MFMYVLTPKGRHAIGDCYKNMVNSLSRKDNVSLVHGSCYKSAEFSDDFKYKIEENFYRAGRIAGKYKAFLFSMKLKKLIKKNGIKKILIFDECEWFLIFLYYALRKLNLEWYIYIHDPLSHTGEKKGIRFVRDFVYKHIIPRCKVIFVSYTRAIEELRKDRAIFSDKEIIVQYLPRMKELEFDDLRRDMESGKLENEFDIAFFGRLEDYKGIDVLIDALEILKNKYRHEYKTIIVGSRGDRKDIVRQYAKLNSNVTFIDKYIESRELAEYIAKSRVVVLAYRDATGTQTVQVANYYNKPVIANDVGCFNEYVEHGINGFLLNKLNPESLADAINNLMQDKTLYNSICGSIEGKLTASFDLNKFSDDIYRKISSE